LETFASVKFLVCRSIKKEYFFHRLLTSDPWVHERIQAHPAILPRLLLRKEISMKIYISARTRRAAMRPFSDFLLCNSVVIGVLRIAEMAMRRARRISARHRSKTVMY
jgi:hypothetical protein